jgi:hypothetical protein
VWAAFVLSGAGTAKTCVDFADRNVHLPVPGLRAIWIKRRNELIEGIWGAIADVLREQLIERAAARVRLAGRVQLGHTPGSAACPMS